MDPADDSTQFLDIRDNLWGGSEWQYGQGGDARGYFHIWTGTIW